MSNPHGLFYAEKFANSVHCIFIFTIFLCRCPWSVLAHLWYQVFFSNKDNSQTVVWFQIFLNIWFQGCISIWFNPNISQFP